MVSSPRSDVAFLYRRAGFGLRPEELDRVAAGGYEAAVEELISGLDAPDPTGDRVPVPAFTAGSLTPRAARAQPDPVAVKERNQGVLSDLAALQRWWMDRMIVTSTPLREKLALYWHGHFATGIPKVRDARLMYLQNQLFRTAGGGGFEALAQAAARDGAMMLWLDTNTDKKAHPNENFAREMMELFTLGIGNYTQDDVTAGARGFTGWVYDRLQYRYLFRAAQHDYGPKTYLGRTGAWNGEDIVHIAVTRPESARFVLARLWSHFAYPVHPSDQVVSDLLPAYGAGLEIAAALRALFLHPGFRSPSSRAGLIKQPVEYLAGVARALGLDATGARAAAGSDPSSGSSPGSDPGPSPDPRPGPSPSSDPSRSAAAGAPLPAKDGPGRDLPRLAAALGQTLFDPPNVGGWGQNGYWLTTATAQLRLEAALALAARADLEGLAALPPSQRVAGVAGLLGVDAWGATTAGALARVVGEPAALTALALTSPEYVLA